MLTIHVCQSSVGLLGRKTLHTQWTGATFAQLVRRFRDPKWREDAPLTVISGGRRITDWNLAPTDGAYVTIAPTAGGPGFFNALVLIIVQTALNAAIALLLAPDIDDPVEPGDEASATYAFRGIQTTYGTGLRVPIVYGYHGVGGHAVSTEVTPIDPVTNAESFRSVLVLSEGPIHAVGDVTRDIDLRSPQPGTAFPQGIRVNDTALQADDAADGTAGGVYVSTRLGNRQQTPMRGFGEPNATVAVSAALNDAGDAFVAFIDNTESSRARIQVDFPNGLYKQGGGGVVPIDDLGPDARFSVQVRPTPSDTAWALIPGQVVDVETGAAGSRQPLSRSVDLELDIEGVHSGLLSSNGVHNGWEVRVERLSPRHPDTAQEAFSEDMVFQRIVHGVDFKFSYPGRALFGVHHRGTERLQNRRPNYLVPVKGRKLRVWDSVLGISEKEYFDLPESGDDYHGIWSYPPGRNPAWQAVDYITQHYALGNFIAPPGDDPDDYVDWPAFRDLADYCDQKWVWNPDAPPEEEEDHEAFHSCDIVFDQGVEAWEGLMSILRTCRAVPMLSGRKITVRYRYKNGHGRGNNTVPARSMVDVVGTSSIAGLQQKRLRVSKRPNFLLGQFTNASKNWEQDELPREDPNTLFDASNLLREQARRSSVRMFGITDERRVERELDFYHAINRLADRTVSFEAGIEQLAVEPSDLLGVQHDNLRPLSDTAAYVSARASAAISGTSVTLTSAIEVPAADTAYNVTYKDSDGDIATTTLTPPSGETDIAAGATWTAGATVDCPKGTVFVFGGTGSEDIEVYDITAVALKNDLKLGITGLLWTPDAYDGMEPSE